MLSVWVFKKHEKCHTLYVLLWTVTLGYMITMDSLDDLHNFQAAYACIYKKSDL